MVGGFDVVTLTTSTNQTDGKCVQMVGWFSYYVLIGEQMY